MKSLEELNAIRDKVRDTVVIPDGSDKIRVVVGLATCGIAAGAKPVFNAIVDEVEKAGLGDKISVVQTGCIGICQFEPVVEVFEGGKEKTTYVKMTAEKAQRVVEEHLKGGKPVVEYTIGANLN